MEGEDTTSSPLVHLIRRTEVGDFFCRTLAVENTGTVAGVAISDGDRHASGTDAPTSARCDEKTWVEWMMHRMRDTGPNGVVTAEALVDHHPSPKDPPTLVDNANPWPKYTRLEPTTIAKAAAAGKGASAIKTASVTQEAVKGNTQTAGASGSAEAATKGQFTWVFLHVPGVAFRMVRANGGQRSSGINRACLFPPPPSSLPSVSHPPPLIHPFTGACDIHGSNL